MMEGQGRNNRHTDNVSPRMNRMNHPPAASAVTPYYERTPTTMETMDRARHSLPGPGQIMYQNPAGMNGTGFSDQFDMNGASPYEHEDRRPFEQEQAVDDDSGEIYDGSEIDNSDEFEGLDVNSFEYHQAKFVSAIRKATDLQDEIEADLHGTNVSFTTEYANLLNQFSDFLDILDTCERLESKSDEILNETSS
jgi:hypothetical protein